MGARWAKAWRRRMLRSAGARCGASVLRASGRFTRVRYVHRERRDEALALHGAVIYAFWHGRMWLLAACLGSEGAAVLVSLSEDGEIIARALTRLGLVPARGSTSRGGTEGLRELEAQIAAGRSAALTPDGPRGPARVAQAGAVLLAARTGKPILPLSSASRPAWTLGSWDGFQIPRPGARGVIVYGEPFLVPREDDLEPWRRELERRLSAVEREADTWVTAS